MYSTNYNQSHKDRVNINSIFTPFLAPDETIEWCGQPAPKEKKEISQILFGCFYSGFAVFWAIMASQASLFFALFALPFFLAGLFVIFGQKTKKLRLNTYYAVTDQRCIIVSQYKDLSFVDYRYSTMTGINCMNGSVILSPIPFSPYTYSGRRHNAGTAQLEQSIKSNFIDIGENTTKVCMIISKHINEEKDSEN